VSYKHVYRGRVTAQNKIGVVLTKRYIANDAVILVGLPYHPLEAHVLKKIFCWQYCAARHIELLQGRDVGDGKTLHG
jgi:hypothetical protein